MPATAAVKSPSPRPSRSSRRLGYTVGLVVNGGLLLAVNRTPGWDVVPFLTEDTARVLGPVNASLAIGIVVYALLIVSDPPWLRAVGDIAVNVVGIVALVRIWQVFPFAFPSGGVDWGLIARWVLAVGIAGSVVGILVALTRLVRAPRTRPSARRR